MELIAVFIIIACVVGAIFTIGLTISLAYYLIGGLIIGGLGRLILPGSQQITLLATSLYGIAGSLLGGVATEALGLGTFGSLAASILIAALLVALFAKAGR